MNSSFRSRWAIGGEDREDDLAFFVSYTIPTCRSPCEGAMACGSEPMKEANR